MDDTRIADLLAEPIRSAVAALLRSAGLPDSYRAQALSGGNNRVYRLQTEQRPVVLKWYFSHADDKRDRLTAEYAFCRFAWQRGVHQVPQPLATDSERQLALYEFISGRHPTADEVDRSAVESALALVRELNRHQDHPEAADLPTAAEGCFSLSGHLDCIGRRLERLRSIEPLDDVHRQALALVEEHIKPAWNDTVQQVESEAAAANIDMRVKLPTADRCLSPSDFGFHNALIDTAGHLRFIDFEYAGWDDPVKLVCDFFCQVALPAPLDMLPAFADALFASVQNAEVHRRRLQWLFPAYRLKWCGILLNEFLPLGRERRGFGGSLSPDRLQGQLEKARAAFARYRQGEQHE